LQYEKNITKRRRNICRLPLLKKIRTRIYKREITDLKEKKYAVCFFVSVRGGFIRIFDIERAKEKKVCRMFYISIRKPLR
jgi:pimeloyl-CoA synthetase